MSAPEIKPLSPCAACDGCKLRATLMEHLDKVVRPYFEPLLIEATREYTRRLEWARGLPNGTHDDRCALDSLRASMRNIEQQWERERDRVLTHKLLVLSSCERIGVVVMQ